MQGVPAAGALLPARTGSLDVLFERPNGAFQRRFLAAMPPLPLRHAVAHADLGEYILGHGGVFFDFAAYVGHVHAQQLRVAA